MEYTLNYRGTTYVKVIKVEKQKKREHYAPLSEQFFFNYAIYKSLTYKQPPQKF